MVHGFGFLQQRVGVCLVAYVVMPERLHLLVYAHAKGEGSYVPISQLWHAFKKQVDGASHGIRSPTTCVRISMHGHASVGHATHHFIPATRLTTVKPRHPFPDPPQPDVHRACGRLLHDLPSAPVSI